MAASSSPLTFDLPLSLIQRIEEIRTNSNFPSVSEVVRYAIDQFEFADFDAAHEEHRQISVRLSPMQKALVTRVARKKNVSAGELLRVAIDHLPARPIMTGAGMTRNQGKVMSKKTPSKTAKKAAPKVVKKAAKKAAAKKAK